MLRKYTFGLNKNARIIFDIYSNFRCLYLATPLILASIAGLLLEGKMLAACFVSAALAALTGSVWLGAIFIITRNIDQIVLAINSQGGFNSNSKLLKKE